MQLCWDTSSLDFNKVRSKKHVGARVEVHEHDHVSYNDRTVLELKEIDSEKLFFKWNYLILFLVFLFVFLFFKCLLMLKTLSSISWLWF